MASVSHQVERYSTARSRSSLFLLLVAIAAFAVAACLASKWETKPFVVPPNTRTLFYVYGAMVFVGAGTFLTCRALRINAWGSVLVGVCLAIVAGWKLVF